MTLNCIDLRQEKLEEAGKLVGYQTGTRYRIRGEFLFSGIELGGAHVLEVGCGSGAWAIWAAIHGASHVLGIEPGADGSSHGVLESLQDSIARLGLDDLVEARSAFMHELPIPERPYDVVVMYNVINHLDEDAVIVLDRDHKAEASYVARFEDLRSRMRSGSWLIIADCGRDNLWPRLGLTSPFVPSIEWHKHQNPRIWMSVLERAGFRTIDLRWSPLQPFINLTANRLVQYLTCSHFVLRVQAR